MELTDETMNTQFDDKVDDYKTLEHNKTSCRLETYEETLSDHYKLFFHFETITNCVGYFETISAVIILNNKLCFTISGITSCVSPFQIILEPLQHEPYLC